MINRVVEFLREYDLCDKTIVVGFSGGYDSMCLLDVLSKIKDLPEFINLSIISAHFNHNWRGEESLWEQEACRLFATSKGFEFYSKTAPNWLKKTENDARIARYEFFEEVVEDFDADAVFTAHNKDDNAETVLYRAVKGTGIVGLKGISVKRDLFYRPLLKVSRAEILDYCEKNNLKPNHDSSNDDTSYRRNYIRLNILPALEKINPSVKEALNTLADVAQSEDLIIQEYLDGIKQSVFSDEKILSEEYKSLSLPVKKRIIYDYLQLFDLDYDFKKIKDIFDFIELNLDKRNGNTYSLTSGTWLYVDEKVIEIIPNRRIEERIEYNKEYVIDGEGEYVIGEHKLIIKPYVARDVFIFPEATANFVYVDLSNIKQPLVLRHRKDGDVIKGFVTHKRNPLEMSLYDIIGEYIIDNSGDVYIGLENIREINKEYWISIVNTENDDNDILKCSWLLKEENDISYGVDEFNFVQELINVPFDENNSTDRTNEELYNVIKKNVDNMYMWALQEHLGGKDINKSMRYYRPDGVVSSKGPYYKFDVDNILYKIERGYKEYNHLNSEIINLEPGEHYEYVRYINNVVDIKPLTWVLLGFDYTRITGRIINDEYPKWTLSMAGDKLYIEEDLQEDEVITTHNGLYFTYLFEEIGMYKIKLEIIDINGNKYEFEKPIVIVDKDANYEMYHTLKDEYDKYIEEKNERSLIYLN